MSQNTQLLLNKKIARDFGRAISKFSMIRDGDKILVGLSGGKDSSILLYSLCRLRHRCPVSFNIKAVTVVPDEGKTDLSLLYRFTESLDVHLEVISYPIFSILGNSPSSSPCSLCANIRRGILAGKAKELGFNVLALGHHRDDAVETVFLNLLFAGSFKCFHPNMLMGRSGIRVIRPLVFTGEEQIKKESMRLKLPNIDFNCNYKDTSQRGKIKTILREMSETAPDLHGNVIHALMNFKQENSWSCEP